jgi:hypothetical protein
MDDVEQFDRFPSLVGLEAANSVKPDIRISRAQGSPFGERLLDSIFTEIPLPGGNQRLDLFRVSALADGDQPDILPITPRQRRRLIDSIEDPAAAVFGGHRAAL